MVGGNPGVQGDAWEVTLGRLRDVRPRLDVAWRAADAGEIVAIIKEYAWPSSEEASIFVRVSS